MLSSSSRSTAEDLASERSHARTLKSGGRFAFRAAVDGGLAHSVGDVERVALAAEGAHEGDERFCVGVLLRGLDHGRRRGEARRVDRAQADAVDGVPHLHPLLPKVVAQLLRRHGVGAADQHVEAALGGDDVGDHGLHGALDAAVADARRAAAAQRVDLLRGPLDGQLLVGGQPPVLAHLGAHVAVRIRPARPADGVHGVARAAQLQRDALADAARRARDDGHAPAVGHGHSPALRATVQRQRTAAAAPRCGGEQPCDACHRARGKSSPTLKAASQTRSRAARLSLARISGEPGTPCRP